MSGSTASPSRRQRLVADVDGQPQAGDVGSRLERGAFGSGDADGDGLAWVIGAGTTGAALLWESHGGRIGDTETIAKPGFPYYGYSMRPTYTLARLFAQARLATAPTGWCDEHDQPASGCCEQSAADPSPPGWCDQHDKPASGCCQALPGDPSRCHHGVSYLAVCEACLGPLVAV